MRNEIASTQVVGFALTEACFFYGLVGGFIAFFSELLPLTMELADVVARRSSNTSRRGGWSNG